MVRIIFQYLHYIDYTYTSKMKLEIFNFQKKKIPDKDFSNN